MKGTYSRKRLRSPSPQHQSQRSFSIFYVSDSGPAAPLSSMSCPEFEDEPHPQPPNSASVQFRTGLSHGKMATNDIRNRSYSPRKRQHRMEQSQLAEAIELFAGPFRGSQSPILPAGTDGDSFNSPQHLLTTPILRSNSRADFPAPHESSPSHSHRLRDDSPFMLVPMRVSENNSPVLGRNHHRYDSPPESPDGILKRSQRSQRPAPGLPRSSAYHPPTSGTFRSGQFDDTSKPLELHKEWPIAKSSSFEDFRAISLAPWLDLKNTHVDPPALVDPQIDSGVPTTTLPEICPPWVFAQHAWETKSRDLAYEPLMYVAARVKHLEIEAYQPPSNSKVVVVTLKRLNVQRKKYMMDLLEASKSTQQALKTIRKKINFEEQRRLDRLRFRQFVDWDADYPNTSGNKQEATSRKEDVTNIKQPAKFVRYEEAQQRASTSQTMQVHKSNDFADMEASEAPSSMQQNSDSLIAAETPTKELPSPDIDIVMDDILPSSPPKTNSSMEPMSSPLGHKSSGLHITPKLSGHHSLKTSLGPGTVGRDMILPTQKESGIESVASARGSRPRGDFRAHLFNWREQICHKLNGIARDLSFANTGQGDLLRDHNLHAERLHLKGPLPEDYVEALKEERALFQELSLLIMRRSVELRRQFEATLTHVKLVAPKHFH